jgi:hypothetical protein
MPVIYRQQLSTIRLSLGAAQGYITTCHFQVHMLQIYIYLKECTYLYLQCLCKEYYCSLVVDFQIMGPVFLTQYTSLHLGQII